MEDYGPPFYNTDALYGEEEKKQPKKRLTMAKVFAIIIMFLIALAAFSFVGFFLYHYEDMTNYIYNQTVSTPTKQ